MNCKLGLQCIWSFYLGLAFSGAWAAVPQAVGVDELKKALAFYQSIERLDVDFKQTKLLKDIQLKLESEGHLTLKLPGRVEWKILKPQPMSVELEQEKVTIHTPSSDQTFSQTENPSAKDRKSFETMLSWLKLDASAIAEKFTVSKVDTRHYRFVSRETNEPMLKSLEMELTPAGHVAKLSFQEASGDEIRIQFGTPKVTYHKRP